MRGRDVLGLAQTGTGKTAAFALPMISRLAAAPGGRGPRALILAPTRELAAQIRADLEMLARFTAVRVTTVFGGVPTGPQARALRARPDIVVACPGRLLDLMRRGSARLDGIEMLVLDEADQMLDMGFLPDIRAIIARLPSERQTMLFSATMPRPIRALADSLLVDPCVAEAAHAKPVQSIDHAFFTVAQRDKLALLRQLLEEEAVTAAIVFSRTKHRARRLADDLCRAGVRAVALQGNMTQGQRKRAMDGFRDGGFDVLVATDIAARGIDVARVSHVVNFDLPATSEAYTHRIGRTGRAGEDGLAWTFVTREDVPAARTIERRLNLRVRRFDPAIARRSAPANRGRPRRRQPAAASRRRRR